MRVLLDTCVLAELRRPEGDRDVTDAVSSVTDNGHFPSVLTLVEISKGIALLPAGKKLNRSNART